MSIGTCHNKLSSQDNSSNKTTVGSWPAHHRKSYNSRSKNSDVLQRFCFGGGEQCSRPGDCLLCFNLSTQTDQTNLTTTSHPVTPPDPPRPQSHTNPPDQYTIVNTSHLKQVFDNCLKACSICDSNEIQLEIKNRILSKATSYLQGLYVEELSV